MTMTKHILLIVTALILLPTAIKAQKNREDYDVIKLDTMSRPFRPGQLLVKFKDKSELTCYLDGSKLGLDSGRVWVKGVNRVKLIKDMKKVNLVKSM